MSNTNNFSRASDVAFVCLNLASGATALPLSECGLNSGDNSPSGTTSHHLHAVVTQSERGEVAVVDLAATSGVALIDNSPSVPGYNFLPVAPGPTALVVDVRAMGATSQVWVASATRQQIQRLDVRALRRDPRAVQADLPATTPITLPGAPTDLAIDTLADGRVMLYATIPDRGAVVAVDVTDPLSPTVRSTVPLASTGGMDAGVSDAGMGATPRPTALAVDARSHRLYVADEATTVIHVLDGAQFREETAINLGFRTRSLALSGWVRARAGCTDASADPDHCARARYLYAIAAEDGALYAYDLVRGARVRANLLPQPNARARRVSSLQGVDPIALPAPATAVTALNTGDYVEMTDPADPSGVVIQANAPCETSACTSGVTPAPGALRGVFMAVTLRNGSMTFIDLDDYDAACREAACNSGTSGQAAYRFIRHAPRALSILTEPPKLAVQPAITGIIRGTDRTPLSDLSAAPTFACGPSRDRNACTNSNNFGVELTRREDLTGAAAVADPYVTRNESWGITYEGILPGLDQAGGAFSVDTDGALRLDLPGAAFCTRGTLANNRARDIVTIVSDSMAAAADLDACNATFGTGQATVSRDFVIERAYEDRLILRPSQDVTPELVARCYPQATRFQVRTGEQWLVLGSRAGFQTAVRPNAMTRECEVDPVRQADVERLAAGCLTDRVPVGMRVPQCVAGRACTGGVDAMGVATAALAPVFANPYFCTQLFPALARSGGTNAALPIARETQIVFTISGAYEPYFAEVGSFPVNIRYAPSIARLYVVDTQDQGLLEFRMAPLTRGRQFN